MRYLWIGWVGWLWSQLPFYPENPYQSDFDLAYQTHPLVPRGALEAIAYVQSRFTPLTPTAGSCTGIPQGWGLFGWIEDGKGYFRENLSLITALSRLPVQAIKDSPRLQVEALARAYENLMLSQGVSSDDWEGHKALFLSLSYLPLDPDPVNDFARQSELFEIFRFLSSPEAGRRYGFRPWPISLERLFGENYPILSSTQVILTDEQIQTPDGYTYRTTNNTDYPGAIWNPAASCNYNARPSGTSITHVTIHTVQGTYAGCISWFKNCNAQVSAHYVLRSSDGQITQMVREADRAWHVGTENNYTIGLEHEGYINNPSWYTVAMYTASAALVRDICQRRNISRNSVWFGDACSGSTSACLVKSCIRIKGHQQYPNQTHTDPGPNWNWNYYYQLIAGPTYSIHQTFTTPSGTVYDPGGASGDYSNNQRHFIKIAPPGATSVTLNFQQFNLENNFASSTKGGDYLYIYDGDTTTAPLLRRLTGTTLPNPITSTTGTLLLELRTDCSTPMAGWQLSYNATFSGGTGSPDNTPPTTSIGPTPDWVTADFPLTFQDEDDGGRNVEKAFYLVMYDSAGDWRANPERGFFSDNFVGPALHPDWVPVKGTWLILDPGNGDPVLRQNDESSADASNTNLYAYLKQNLSNRYLYHWAGRFVGGNSTNRRMGLHIFADNPTATNRGNSYFVFFRLDGSQFVQLYKVTNDSWGSGPVAQVSYPFQAGVWYDFKWSYDRITGDHRVYINNQLVLSWKDSSPIAAGDFISLRTGNALVEYNNFKVYRSRPNSGTVTIRVGSGAAQDIRRQSDHPSHYVARIRSIAQDTAGNLSQTPARDVRVDWTPPTAPSYVWDGEDPTQDTDQVDQDTLLSASWGIAEDPHSGIADYEYCLATSVGDSNVISWTATSATSAFSSSLSPQTLQPGITYYVGIRAINGAGWRGQPTYSDGFMYHPVSTALGRITEQVLLFPNPSRGAAKLWVLSSDPSLAYKVEVLLPTGQAVWRSTGKVGEPLSLPPLSQGVYIVRLSFSEERTSFLRWVVE
ncbi:MAG: N-acetylmuramoyl-L-alanine amidase [Bacteroidia bacterium]|nr:N-acetylmuramoyl-L-alanine amidase [Bacteroidia bacterium]